MATVIKYQQPDGSWSTQKAVVIPVRESSRVRRARKAGNFTNDPQGSMQHPYVRPAGHLCTPDYSFEEIRRQQDADLELARSDRRHKKAKVYTRGK